MSDVLRKNWHQELFFVLLDLWLNISLTAEADFHIITIESFAFLRWWKREVGRNFTFFSKILFTYKHAFRYKLITYEHTAKQHDLSRSRHKVKHQLRFMDLNNPFKSYPSSSIWHLICSKFCTSSHVFLNRTRFRKAANISSCR